MWAVQEWIAYAQTRTARHKLAKFLKDNADLVDPSSPPDVAFREASGTTQQEATSSSRQAATGREGGTQVRTAGHFHP